MDIAHDVKSLIGKALRPIHAGDKKLTSHQEGIGATGGISVQSQAFEDGQLIPRKYSAEGDNLSPPLRWTGVPKEAKEVVLICEDPDAPFPHPFLHWAMLGIGPERKSMPESVPPTAKPEIPAGAIQLKNGGKTTGYTGPIPPIGHGVHHYHFQLFALDKTLALDETSDRDMLMKAMKGHVIAQGEVVGTYERK